jgi:hypothetical protein
MVIFGLKTSVLKAFLGKKMVFLGKNRGIIQVFDEQVLNKKHKLLQFELLFV